MISGEPWERVSIDVTGPHPVSTKGNAYILTVIDHFTKWVELFPMRNQEAPTVARILVDRVFCVHGCPIQILTDRGPNFESQLFRELYQRLSIDKVRTTAYHASCNGAIERFHSTMHSLIAKWVNDKHRDWDQHLPAVAFAYRTTEQESTGLTPYFMLHGRKRAYQLTSSTAHRQTRPPAFLISSLGSKRLFGKLFGSPAKSSARPRRDANATTI